MPRLDQFLRDKCVAVGLDPAELNQMRAAATARREALAAGVPVGVGTTRWRQSSGSSFSLSVRLDHDEIDELRRRADERGIGVSVLARAYIRKSLAGRSAGSADMW